MRTQILLLFQILWFIFGTSTGQSQTLWSPYQYNPVIDTDFDPGSIIIHRSSVVYDGGTYRMWYANTIQVEVGFIKLKQSYMGYATSPDGLNWTLVSPKVMSPTSDQNVFDQFHASQGWVIFHEDTFKMWYWGFNAFTGGYGLNAIGYAWSLDGENWNRVEGPGDLGSVYDLKMAALPDSSGLATPCVVFDGDEYHMWYSQVAIQPFLFRIGYARSPDGIHWTRMAGSGTEGAVLDWGPEGSFDQYSVSWPAVCKTTNGFEMWYFGTDGAINGIGYAVSENGIEWQRVNGGGEKGLCLNDALAGSVLRIGDQYKMWYCGMDEDIVNYATSDVSTSASELNSSDLVSECALEQNFPNPFNPVTTIGYSIPSGENEIRVTLTIYNICGGCVRILIDENQRPGHYTVRWDGKDENGNSLAGGLYLYRIRAGRFMQTNKMILLR